MKQMRIWLGTLLLLFLPLVAWVGLAHAQEFRSGPNVTVAQNQTVNSALWAAGSNIDIAGNINGDVFCAGQSVNISATVNGDVICAAQNIHISGPVNGNIRVAGQQVTLGSKVGGSLSVVAQSFALDQNASVGRDASVASSDTTINGTVSRDLVVAGSTVTINNAVGRNVNATSQKVMLTSSAHIGGRLDYTSHNNAQIAAGATIAGGAHRSEPVQRQEHHAGFAKISIVFGLYLLVTFLIVALVLALLLPGLLVTVSDIAWREPLRIFLTGLIASLLFPVLFIALLVTVIGIPLALLLLWIWILIVVLGWFFFSFYIGRLIFRGRTNVILAMLVGALIVAILMQIPILGFIVWLAALWLGSGMVLTWLFRRYRRPSYALPQD